MKLKSLFYFFSTALIFLSTACSHRPENAVQINRTPIIYPDFTGATFPLNIAAPTFQILEEGDKYFVDFGKEGEDPFFFIGSSDGEIIPSLNKWQNLLEQAKGSSIYIRVFIEKEGQQPVRMADINCPVSHYPVDSHLVYRLLYPGYVLWNQMGIYQRNLTDYSQQPVLENKDIEGQCLNCHSFHNGSPETMSIHIRGKNAGTVLRRSGVTQKVIPNCPGLENGATYPSWHPSGKYIAFSANKIQQIFHAKGTKTVEVVDLAADMTIYDVEKNETFTSPFLSGDEWMETFPNWNKSGDTLYFCRAKGYTENMKLDTIRYNLCKIPFNPSTREFGEVETVVQADIKGKSVSFPRVSPDGRWLLFTLSDYGNFSIWHPEADLLLFDMQDGKIRCVDELNSDDVESYHSWSSNGRWIVFSSKRMDGLWARPFIASFDPATGKFGIPFPIPQKKPKHYKEFMKTYNIPEFVTSPVERTQELIKEAQKEIPS